ncbi:MAG: hypothetical protein ACHQ01_00850 [Candidatus Limnocylindrales bacterium]
MGYWIASFALIGFGIAGIMTIGRTFLLIGLTMLILGPLRRRALVFWPLMTASIAYSVASLLIEPFYCSASSSPGGDSATTCSSLLGIPWPAVAGGLADPASVTDTVNRLAIVLAVAVFAFVLGWLMLHREAQAKAQ